MTNNGKLDKEITAAICKSITEGVSRKEAALINGICEGTFYNWINRGKEAKSGKYLEFLKSIKKAESILKASYERSIHVAKDKDWRAGMTWLERRCPSEYGRSDRMQVEHSGKISFSNFKELMTDTDEQTN